MRDIQEGCEGVVGQLERWTNALMVGEFDILEEVLAPDFQFTVEPKFGGGRMDKAQFIALDRKIKSCSINLIDLTARKMGNLVTTLAMAEVSESFEGDLGPGMPSAEEMAATMQNARLAYGSGWRVGDDGTWQCFSHHVFGFVN